MKTEKKITIKVKSKIERRIMEPEVEMVTEWNIKRIVIALLILLLLIAIPVYYLRGADTHDSNIANGTTIISSTASPLVLKPVLLAEKPEQHIAEKETVVSGAPPAGAVVQFEQDAPFAAKADTKDQQVKRANETVFQQKNIARSQLALGVYHKEPFGKVALPLVVNKTKAGGIFYFTEVINLQGKTVFHEWLFQGKVVYKRKFNIKGKRWRIATSKLFDTHYIGAWQVRIVTQKGEVLQAINFAVQ